MSDRGVITVGGDSVTLRATGIGRYVEAGFLGLWIVLWAIAEAFVLAVLGSMLAALFGFLRDSALSSTRPQVGAPLAARRARSICRARPPGVRPSPRSWVY